MAYVVKDARKRSPFWYAIYRDASGRRVRKSTQLTSKSKALEIARTLQKASDEARRGVLTESRTRELLSEILQGINGGGGLPLFTVRQWLDQFVTQKQKSRAEKTALRHEQMMEEFVAFIGDKANLNIAAITSADIAAFRDHRSSRGLAPSTLNVDITVLSAAFNAALRQGHITVNPCLAIEPVKDKVNARRDVFSPEQVRALVKAADGDWPGLILTAF